MLLQLAMLLLRRGGGQLYRLSDRSGLSSAIHRSLKTFR
jgi:hypothetical protein